MIMANLRLYKCQCKTVGIGCLLSPRDEKKIIYIFLSLFCCPHDYNRVPSEIKRREVELDPQVSPEEIMSREVELGCESWTSFASGCSSTAVQRTLSL